MHEQNTQSSLDFALAKMTPQSSRFGKENLFFAILPDRQALDECLDLQKVLRRARFPVSSPRPRDLLHVSLYHVDQRTRVSEQVIFAACRAASAIDARDFDLSFDHVATFRTSPGNAIVLSGNGGRELMRQLHIQIGIEMHNLGEVAHIRRDFQPHMTLLYDRDTAPKIAIEKPVTVPAREFVLLHSRPGERKYDYVGRWPLQARG